MLEEDNLEVTAEFSLDIWEAISAYTLYRIFEKDILQGVENGIGIHETPPALRPEIRAAIPKLIADLRAFLAANLAPEVMTEVEEEIAQNLAAIAP